jgi:hypothetical protein
VNWRAILTGVLLFACAGGQAIQPVLVPGALKTDCRSALQVGVVVCGDDSGDTNHASPISEAQITSFLDAYGKPPREAVRALLDPSDANIAAWLKKQRQVLAIASYVASRMTEMQSQLQATGPSSSPLSFFRSSAMMQMRATLYLSSVDLPSLRAVHALQQVVTQYPSLDGRLVRVTPTPEESPSAWLAKLDTVLPVSVEPSGPMASLPLPSLLIADLRYGSTRRLNVTEITPQIIQDQIVALRAAAEMRDLSSGAVETLP